jgi:RNA polymerase sigma factor (sigma-70 family)
MKIPEPMGHRGKASVEELLAHAGWLRDLALQLARDPAAADDAVQETWIAALRRAPEARESVRPWLARVLRNALRMRARGDGRRSAREQVAGLAADDVPTPEVLLARAETQRLLANLVLRLDEPYRSTVLLHYCEGVSLAEIARASGIAASTARWRLKTALDQLRSWLDAETGGRETWAIALLAVPQGVVMAQKTKLTALIIALLLLLGAGAGYLLWPRGEPGEDDGGGDRRPLSAAFDRTGAPGAADPAAAPMAWLAQPGIAPRRIAGRVTFAGEPVAGAAVELASLASESGLVAAPRLVTGEGGEFDFGPRPAIEWSVRASAPGRTGAVVDVDLRSPIPTPPADQLELALGPCDSAIFGTVGDASGGPIAGARVARIDRGGASVPGGAAVETAADGSYELCVAASTPYWMSAEVSAAGYGAVVVNARVSDRLRVDLMLVPEAVITGRVVRDDTGEPVPGAHVYLPRGPWWIESTAWRGAFAGDDGRFELRGVAPGRHRVLARAPGMASARRDQTAVVDAGRTVEIEIRMEAAATVEGVVLEDGAPVAGARVAVIAADGSRGPRSAVSQADGNFSLGEVPRGEVRFTASPYDVIRPERFEVAAAHHRVVLEVEPLGAITGTVVRRGRPVAGARIDIHGPNEGDLAPITTGEGGRFEARGLRPGPWTLFASSEQAGAFGRAPEVIELERGETAETTIELAYAAAIEGVVVDQDGAPVAAAAVEFHHAGIDDVGVAITAADGSFRAATMTGGGDYRPVVRARPGSSASLPPASGERFAPIALADGASEVTGVVLAVRLDRLSIAGRVVDGDGVPVADARVAAQRAAPGETPRFYLWLREATATTGVDGRFAIADLSAGTFALQARATTGIEATVTGVKAGRADVAIALPSPGAIRGVLVGFTGAVEVGAKREGGAGTSSPINADVAGGSFAIRALSPGTYVITARSAAQAASGRAEVEAGATARISLTAGGSGVVSGRVRTFRGGAPVEGMTCSAFPRAGDGLVGGGPGDGARTDAAGRFVISPAPAGAITVACGGLWRLYSDGLRLIELTPDQRAEIDVPVVAWRGDVAVPTAGFGAELERGVLIPRLTRVRPGGAAARAGFADGDRVVAVDGADVTALSPHGVHILIANRPPGETVDVTVTRGGRRITGALELGEPDPR